MKTPDPKPVICKQYYHHWQERIPYISYVVRCARYYSYGDGKHCIITASVVMADKQLDTKV